MKPMGYIFDKIKILRQNYGPTTFFKTQTTGMNGHPSANLSPLYGDTNQITTYRQNWGFASFQHTSPFVAGNGSTTAAPPSGCDACGSARPVVP